MPIAYYDDERGAVNTGIVPWAPRNYSSGTDSDEATNPAPSTIAPGAEFELSNVSMVFAPLFYPRKVVVSKERRHSRQANYCEGEDVYDIGSKNREIHITGYFRTSELDAFNALLDQHDPLDLIADEWTGEAVIENGEYQKFGYDTYEYKLNLVSTGKDERGRIGADGIIRDGADDDSAYRRDYGEYDYNGPAFGL
jgi:hypothetical protein